MKPLEQLVRKNIFSLSPYSSARDEYAGKEARVFLDANENPYPLSPDTPLNRYPDPLQSDLKAALARVKGVAANRIFTGNGSDEAIDLVYRIFCEPRQDNVVAIEPTYGMYAVCANINAVEYRRVLLDDHFQLSAERLLAAADARTKAVFLCSPNNPSGNLLAANEVENAVRRFEGIVVVDEAYADFAGEEGGASNRAARPWRTRLDEFPNLVVLNTFSKAWASAGIRLGMAFASEEIIALFNKVKYPYNINLLTQAEALRVLERMDEMKGRVEAILSQRGGVMASVADLPFCRKVYPSDANFFLAKMAEGLAGRVYSYLVDCGIVVRNRSTISLCGDCLRFTIGTPEENKALLAALRAFPDKRTYEQDFSPETE